MASPSPAVQSRSLRAPNEETALTASTFTILADYVSPASTETFESAAESITSQDPGQNPREFIKGVWKTIFHIAKQIPHHDFGPEDITDSPNDAREVAGHDRLLHVVEYLDMVGNTGYSQTNPWTSPNTVCAALRDFAPPEEWEDEYWPFQEWENLQAFCARLYGGIVLLHPKFIRLPQQRAHEEMDGPSRDVAVMRDVSAALWIKHAGHQILDRVRNPDRYPGERSIRGRVSVERWGRWKKSFEAKAAEWGSGRAGRACGEAVEMMSEVELGCLPYTRIDIQDH